VAAVDDRDGIQWRRVAVVFDGGSSVRQRLMASAMDYDERMRGRRKGRQRKREGGAS
jgi:hypothetical protein